MDIINTETEILNKNLDEISNDPPFSILKVQTQPALNDARELETIIVTSLRALFGEWEPHSCQVKVKSKEVGLFHVECSHHSVGAVRAALTMITTPAYLDATIFRFDVMDMDNSSDQKTLY